jgi:branched-chain amino acid transport system substrate-binding protein
MRALAAVTVVGLLSALLVAGQGCTWWRTQMPPPLEGEPVSIGIPLPLTGPHAPFGQMKKNAYEMAVEEINAAGGVDGRPLVLVIRDTAGQPEAAAAAAERLLDVDGVHLLAGTYSSACALAVARVAERYGVPYVVDSAAADRITRQDWSFVFRVNPPAPLYAEGLTSFLGEVVRPASVAIIHEESDYGVDLARAMREWCKKHGVRITVSEGYEPGTLDFTSVLAKLKDTDPDVVYMVSYLLEAPLIVRQARAEGVRPRLFAGGAGGFALPEFVTDAGQAGEHVVTAALWAPGVPYPRAAEFAETYRARYGEYPTYHGAGAYACIQVIADALHRAASTDPERVRVALADTELMTVFGPVRFESFDGYTNQNRAPTFVLQVLGGQHTVVWPPEAATVAYVFPDPASQEDGGR